ncbi:hypothetical protein [Hydrocarboniphaga effusa]|jgi:hypothetical protein|uniref:hypothetical protein n=1 Tax=Hydrocarboniphaga effusa TaxID=243629 RepID=UPI003137CC45
MHESLPWGADMNAQSLMPDSVAITDEEIDAAICESLVLDASVANLVEALSLRATARAALFLAALGVDVDIDADGEVYVPAGDGGVLIGDCGDLSALLSAMYQLGREDALARVAETAA